MTVSCVTKDPTDNGLYTPHFCGFVDNEVCQQGICTIEVLENNMDVIFSNLNIQFVNVKDKEKALKVRQESQVDPFGSM